MKKSNFLLTAIGASVILSSNNLQADDNVIKESSINIEKQTIDYTLRVISNGFGYLKQAGHIYILKPNVVSNYNPNQLNDLIGQGSSLICNRANCIKFNISTRGIDLLV